MVAYSLVEDFDQYKMKQDQLEALKQDSIGKLRFECFFKFVENEKFEARLKQIEKEIREEYVN